MAGKKNLMKEKNLQKILGQNLLNLKNQEQKINKFIKLITLKYL